MGRPRSCGFSRHSEWSKPWDRIPYRQAYKQVGPFAKPRGKTGRRLAWKRKSSASFRWKKALTEGSRGVADCVEGYISLYCGCATFPSPYSEESMLLDEDPFPPVPTINTVTLDLPSLLDAKRAAKAAHVQEQE